MRRVQRLWPSLLAACLAGTPAHAAEEQAVPEDTRIAVEMPALQRALLRQEMVEHTTALHQVLLYLAEDRLDEAAEAAEQQLGTSSMGRHAARTGGMGPGRFMPDGMRAIGVGMHGAASEFAEVARGGDREAAYRALQSVTAACVGCHSTYRLD